MLSRQSKFISSIRNKCSCYCHRCLTALLPADLGGGADREGADGGRDHDEDGAAHLAAAARGALQRQLLLPVR